MTGRAGVLLVRGGLSGAVFAVTKWREKDGRIEAIEKHDVTDQFDALVAEQLREAEHEQHQGPGAD